MNSEDLFQVIWQYLNLTQGIYLNFEEFMKSNPRLFGMDRFNWRNSTDPILTCYYDWLSLNPSVKSGYNQFLSMLHIQLLGLPASYVHQSSMSFLWEHYNQNPDSPPKGKTLTYHNLQLQHPFGRVVNTNTTPLSVMIMDCADLNSVCKKQSFDSLALQKKIKLAIQTRNYPFA